MEEKKNLLTYAGLKKLEDELHDLKVVKRKEVAEKIKEAREQGDLSENAEYDAAKDEQRDIEARIEEIEKILKNAEVVVEDEVDLDRINVGCKVKVHDYEFDEDMELKIVGSTELTALKQDLQRVSCRKSPDRCSYRRCCRSRNANGNHEIQSSGDPEKHLITKQKTEGGQRSAEQKKQDTNQLLKVRREKLADLQANGKDPFQITKFDQTHHSLEVKELYEAHEAELLKDRETPDVEGLDEAQAREVLKKDYEERREIMDASPIHVAIAGRMMFKRVMGKASFCNIQDLQGNIQVYVARDAIGEESYADFKKSDIGDIFGLEGFAFRTRTGEISIHAEKMTLLSKSLQILRRNSMD